MFLPSSHRIRLILGITLIAVAIAPMRGQDDGSSLTINTGTTITTTGSATLTLTGVNTYSGSTTISSGTLQVTGGTTLGSSTDITITGGTLDTGNTGTTTGGAISLNTTGAGTLTLTGANTYTGGTTISSGTLQITGGSTVGTLTLSSMTLAFTPDAIVAFTLPSTLDTETYAGVSLAGTLQLTIPGTLLSQLDSTSSFTLISSSTPITGSFTNVASGGRLATTDGSGSFLIDYSGDALVAGDFQPADALGGVDIGNGWKKSSWFGVYYPQSYPWVYHQQLGYIYVSATSNPNNLCFNATDMGLGWCYTTAQIFPMIYSYQQNAWLSYQVGTTNFYNFSTGQWETP